MRILYLHQHFCPPEGIGNNRSLELAKVWQKLGYDVTILAGSGQFTDQLPFYRLSKSYVYDGLKVIRLNVAYSHFMPYWRRSFSFIHFFFYAFCQFLSLPRHNIVYASSTPLSIGLLGIMYKRISSAKLLFETVDLWPDVPIEMGILTNKWLVNITLSLEKWIYRESLHIICLSEGMKDKLVTKGLHSEKILVAHNGTNCLDFTPSVNKKENKHSLGYKEDDFIVLYAGTIGIANQVTYLANVAVEIQHLGISNIHFLVIGNGNRREELISYAHKQSIHTVRFMDSIPKKEMGLYFQSVDVAMVTFAPFKILETNSANKFFDYLAAGLPVMINYGGWQENYLTGYECGYSETEPRKMAELILKLSTSKELCAMLSRNARELALAKFQRKDIAQTIAQLFKRLS